VQLTYSCPTTGVQPITLEALHAFFKAGLAVHGSRRKVPTEIVTSEELHQNGTPHFHVYLHFPERLTSSNMAIFDFMGIHPNRQWDKEPDDMIVYVAKDDKFIAHNVDVPAARERVAAKNRLRAAAAEKAAKKVNGKGPGKESFHVQAIALAKLGKMKEATTLMELNDARHWATHSAGIMRTWQDAYEKARRDAAPVVIHNQGWVTPIADLNIEALLDGEDYRRTHVLVGPAGIGKTEFALYLLSQSGCQFPIVVNQIEDLKGKHYDGVVFDECGVNADDAIPRKWTREQQICLVDRQHDRTLPARFSNVMLGNHVVRILTTNNLSRCIDANDPAISRRITVHDLVDKLFA